MTSNLDLVVRIDRMVVGRSPENVSQISLSWFHLKSVALFNKIYWRGVWLFLHNLQLRVDVYGGNEPVEQVKFLDCSSTTTFRRIPDRVSGC
jgi:hypothetical protein